MKYTLSEALFWITLYCALALAPLVVALLGEVPPARSFGVELGVMLGLVAFGVLLMQMLVTGRFGWFARGFGHDTLLRFHRQMGIFALLAILAHPATLFVADARFIDYLDPRADLLRASSLWFVLVAAVLLVATSLWRLAINISYEWWRLIHGVLSVAVVAIGLGHLLLVDHYSAPLWKKTAFVVLASAALYLLAHSRLVRPLAARRRPYRVHETRAERAGAVTLVLEPHHGDRLRFRPGQFVMLTLGDSPLSLQQHPFSLASSARAQRFEITAKGSGDFTAGLPQVEPGTRAWIEGPYGSFTHDLDKCRGAVFIAGGVGITPIISMLRTYRDRGAKFPLILIYANASWEDVIFRHELEQMRAELKLALVHVLNEPPPGWSGETGFVDAALLQRHLPADHGEYEYFVCGPTPMMDAVEPLLIKRGIDARRVFSERFEM